MAYVLADGPGKKVGVYCLCEDVRYAQAEALYLTEKLKKETPDIMVVAGTASQPDLTVQQLTDAYRKNPEAWKRIEQIYITIETKGYVSQTVRKYEDFEKFVDSQPEMHVGLLMQSIRKKVDFTHDKEFHEAVEQIYANPLLAGVHEGYKAHITDEAWIQEALSSIRRGSIEKWLGRMLGCLRFYLRGTAKVIVPHKNDRCFCGSSKKFGKCCGPNIEPGDPEECKVGEHDLTDLETFESKWIRHCRQCFRVFEAPWSTESEIDGVKAVVLGCRHCDDRPEAGHLAAEIAKTKRWHACGVCAVPIQIETVLFEHEYNGPRHGGAWYACEVIHKEAAMDVESKAAGKRVFAHKACFEKAFPHWSVNAKAVLQGEMVTPVK